MDFLRKQDSYGERAVLRLALTARRALVIMTALACTATLAAFGQAHGVPPSITSIGSSGFAGGPPPSITSMGPFGWQNPPRSAQGFARPFPCAIFSSPSQSSTSCVNSVLPGIPGQAPFFPFGQGAFGPAGPAPGGAGYLLPGGGFGYGRQGPYTGPGVVAVGVPYGYAAPYPEQVPGDLVVAAEPPDGQQPTVMGNRLTYAPVMTANPGGAPASSSPSAVAGGAIAPTTFVPPQKSTVLVLRDGRRLEVVNYAIVGNQIVNMSGSPGKIPVSDLDVSATVQANDDRGVQFSLPTANRKDAKRDK